VLLFCWLVVPVSFAAKVFVLFCMGMDATATAKTAIAAATDASAMIFCLDT
jgi:hypothetical protein